MYAEKQSDELLLKLKDTRELWDSWNPKKGDTIAIEDGAAKTGKMFVESVVPESGLITLRAYSAPQSTKDKRSKSWEKVKFLQLAQEIAGRHSLTLETYGITDQTYDYVEQNNLADFAFFQNRCTLEGAAFLVYDGKLVVYDEAYMESQQPVDTITITPANDFEYRDEGTNAYGSAEAVNGGLTGTFTMTAFEQGRHIEVYGTKGKIRAGAFYKENGPGEITVTPHFGGKTRVVELEELAGGYQGHGGGDWGLVEALYDDMLTVPSPADMTTSIEESAHSHVMAFATEHARLTGQVVDVAEFERRVMRGELDY